LQGGSAYLFVGRNKIHDCGTTGFGAGQSTGLQYMTPPWFHYECMDVKFVNNVLHDIDGAGFGVWGAYNILMAHNTLYRSVTQPSSSSLALSDVKGKNKYLKNNPCKPIMVIDGAGLAGGATRLRSSLVSGRATTTASLTSAPLTWPMGHGDPRESRSTKAQ